MSNRILVLLLLILLMGALSISLIHTKQKDGGNDNSQVLPDAVESKTASSNLMVEVTTNK